MYIFGEMFGTFGGKVSHTFHHFISYLVWTAWVPTAFWTGEDTIRIAFVQIETMVLPQGIRTRTTASERFWFNRLSVDVHFNGATIPAAGVLREPLA